jgi:hypothetical protein
MRSFGDGDFKKFGFTDIEVQEYKDLFLYGPYTDFVVANSEDTFSTFIKIGYEPITDKILGCRMCSNSKLIRHVQIISDLPSKNMEFIQTLNQNIQEKDHIQIIQNLMKGRIPLLQENEIKYNEICTELYKDVKCQTLSFKKYRMSNEYYLVFETIAVDELGANNYFAANKVLFTTRALQNKWKSSASVGYWNHNLRIWEECNSKCEPLKNTILSNGYFIEFGNSSPILSGSKIGVSVKDFKNLISFAGTAVLFTQKEKTNLIPKFVYNGNPGSSEMGLVTEQDFPLESNKSTLVFDKEDPDYLNLKQIIFKNYNVNQTDLKVIKVTLYNKSHASLKLENYSDYYVLQFSPFIKLIEQPIEKAIFTCDTYCISTSTVSPSQIRKCNFKSDISHHSLLRQLNARNFDNETLEQDNSKTLEIINSNEKLKKDSADIDRYNSFIISSNKDNDNDKRKNHPFIIIDGYDRIEENTRKHFSFRTFHITIREDDPIVKTKNLMLQILLNNNRDRLELKVAEKSPYNWNDLQSNNYKFVIPVKNINKHLYVVFFKDRIMNSKLTQFKDLVFQLSQQGYVLLNKIALHNSYKVGFMGITHNLYAFILIKPLEGYGMINLNDQFNNRKCKNEVYSYMMNNLLPYKTLKGDKKDMKALFDAELANTLSFNFQKIYSAKVNEINYNKQNRNANANRTINFDGLNIGNCREINVFYPVNFSLREEDKKNNFRKLTVENNIIKHEVDPIGPGIRPIYWLNFSLDLATLFNETTLDEFTKKGYRPFLKGSRRTLQWTLGDGRILYATLWVSYDYRMKFDRESICEKCLKVSKILQ